MRVSLQDLYGRVRFQVLSELAPYYFVTFLVGYLPVATLTDKLIIIIMTTECVINFVP